MTHKLILLVTATALLFFGWVQHPAQAQDATLDQARLSIPAIDVDAPIVSAPWMPNRDTWDVSGLHMDAGHLHGLDWFGNGTNVALAGHSLDVNQNPDIFYHLDDIQLGDEISVFVGDVEYRYVVRKLSVVHYTNNSILEPSNGNTLTLFTCHLGSFEDGRYQQRTVVVAEFVGTAS
jgi:LPXTG-site transpeptidase (sortase) family protein